MGTKNFPKGALLFEGRVLDSPKPTLHSCVFFLQDSPMAKIIPFIENLETRQVPAVVVGPQWFQQAKPAATAITATMNTNAPQSEWVVQLKEIISNSLTSVNDANRYLQSPNARLEVVKGLGAKGLFLVKGYGAPETVRSALASLGSVQRFTVNSSSMKIAGSDPMFNQLWGLNNTGQDSGKRDADIDYPEAMARSTVQAQLVVGVVDTGVDYRHPDLKNNMWINPGEIPNNGIDDDGNSFVDDVFGYDFINNDADPMDDMVGIYHGTHVAGTIAAETGNGIGISGIASGAAKVMALKIFDAQGYTSLAAIISACNYSSMMKDRGVDIRLLNNSWGGGPYEALLLDAIKEVTAKNILFVCAAGNDAENNDAEPFYPASFDATGVISVGSSNRSDLTSSFSNYGRSSVDLYAPGSQILSLTGGSGYQYLSGTSMATPHVVGALALGWANQPAFTSQQMVDKLFQSVDQVAAFQGKCVTGGRLNLDKLILSLNGGSTPTPPPAAPSNVRPDNVWSRKVDVAWIDNSDNETGFRIMVSADGGATWSEAGTTRQDATRFRVEGLDAEKSYIFGVQSIAGGDASALARSRSIVTAPPSPTGVRSENVWARTVDLAWNDGSRTETGFRVYVSRNGGASWTMLGTAAANSQRFRVSNLSPSTTYQFAVRAEGAEGLSEYSNTATIVTKAEIPTPDFTGMSISSIGRTSFRLNWNYNLSNAPDRFEVSIEARGSWRLSENVARDRSSALIEFQERNGARLKAGETYRVRIRAVDPAGRAISGWSESLTVRMTR
jgi:subtilisin family serine protease